VSDAVACSFWFRYLRSDSVNRLVLAKSIAEVVYPCSRVSDYSTAILCLAGYLRIYFDDLIKCLEHLGQSSSPSESQTDSGSPSDSSD